jgi:hypothetical protein
MSPDYVAATIALAFLVFLGTVNNDGGQTNLGMLALFQLVSAGVFLVVLAEIRLVRHGGDVHDELAGDPHATDAAVWGTVRRAGVGDARRYLCDCAAGFWMATRAEETYLPP